MLVRVFMCLSLVLLAWLAPPAPASADERTPKQLEQACKKGERAACGLAAQAYFTGVGVKTNYTKAYDLSLTGCVKDDALSCYIRAEVFVSGKGPYPLGPEGAYTSACDLGVIEACRKGFAANGLDSSNGWRYLDSACRHNDADSCFELGKYSLQDGQTVSMHDNYGMPSINKACTLGLEAACNFKTARENNPTIRLVAKFEEHIAGCNAGKLDDCQIAAEIAYEAPEKYPGNNYTPLDAVFPYEELCKAGQAKACSNRGEIIFLASLKPGATATRWPEALADIRQGCALGLAEACVLVGVVHTYDGLFARQSHAIAVGYWDAECRKGNRGACDAASAQRAGGWKSAPTAIDPTLPDITRFMLAERALQTGNAKVGMETLEWLAESGEANSQYTLGMYRRYGDGSLTRKDEQQAEQLFVLAAQKDHPEAIYEANWPLLAEAARTPGVYLDPDWSVISRLKFSASKGVTEAARWVQFDADMREAKRQTADRMVRELAETNRNAVTMDAQTVARAWTQYGESQAKRQGDTVCGLVYEGARTYQQCMSKDHFNKYYTPLGVSN